MSRRIDQDMSHCIKGCHKTCHKRCDKRCDIPSKEPFILSKKKSVRYKYSWYICNKHVFQIQTCSDVDMLLRDSWRVCFQTWFVTCLLPDLIRDVSASRLGSWRVCFQTSAKRTDNAGLVIAGSKRTLYVVQRDVDLRGGLVCFRDGFACVMS